jgi:hypothetical protein
MIPASKVYSAAWAGINVPNPARRFKLAVSVPDTAPCALQAQQEGEACIPQTSVLLHIKQQAKHACQAGSHQTVLVRPQQWCRSWQVVTTQARAQ